MGWFDKKSVKADQWEAEAKEYDREARAEASKAEGYRNSLKSGKSSDPGADRYMIREHQANQWVAAKNAQTLREFAKHERRRWWAPPPK
ncbi:hypothetical protein FH608_024055 [Nonomuraea phyllanthi]|uniref:Uncharacterized protein n=1 Tax=Nonomuraea phyllanthi TaxID=2219224 RepID=A0A5C4W912_9ACTN|nr:hypothetical protein [Nonomuraea phyllanthi]KAB8192578.1 hypothetical protein FH608_024055 [Nonomuraea phyllanthi]QFY08055.1 hypothetical protein GBF35_16440 [Nonomuraea phyllanthi]